MTGRKTVIADLEEAIKAEESLIRTLRTDIEIPRVLQDSIDQTQRQIETLQKKLDAMLHRQANCQQMLYDALDHRDELKQQLAVEKKRHKVEQLLRLQSGILDLQKDTPDDE